MILLAVAVLVSQCCVSGTAAAGGSAAGLERIVNCNTSCSQGLQCRTRPEQLFPRRCQNLAGGLNASSVLRNVSATTVMRCEAKQKCSLHLRTSIDLQLAATVTGVSICVATSGMWTRCRTHRFTKKSREKMSGMQVKVTNDCTQVSPGQRFEIKVEAVPNHCGVVWSGTYVAPACNMEDLKQHVPDCITGRLSYDVNAETKEVVVSVSDMLEGHDYHLRLCRKDFICTGTGAKALILKEEPVKKAVLHYSRPLPCLCIEGWSAVTDASRVQVCPFRDRTEELWQGISFQPLEGQLWWEPACPVLATVMLCQRTEEDVCVDLTHSSQNVSRGKIIFSKVDPHPRLCMKFTVGPQSWIRCPFADARFQEWEAVTGDHDVRLLSKIDATFSVVLWTEGETVTTNTLPVVKQKAVVINLREGLCDSCLHVKRADVQFAVTDIFCRNCNQTPSITPVLSWVKPHPPSLNLTWIFSPLAGLLCVILLALVKVTNDCTQVSPGQRFEIKVEAVPNHCGVVWSGTYVAPACNMEDLKQHVPDCITGRLSYDVNAETKEVVVSVSDMLEGHDYHLRLCRKDFICTGTGAKALILKEEPVKKAVLHYSRPLPCLCIEGWSAVTDASRVQVCPFRDRTEELWQGISFQPLEGQLWWEPACPVLATVMLCQRTEEDVCVDLTHSSQNVSRGKIIFSKVDPHPRLCMKFTVGPQSWIRCPFADARFQEWEAVTGDHDVRLLSKIDATFSVVLWTEGETVTTNTLPVVKQKAVVINLREGLCDSCLHVKRADVQFAVTDIFCRNCNQTPSITPVLSWVKPHPPSLNLTWIFSPLAGLLCVILLALVCHQLRSAYCRRKQKLNKDYTHEPQKDSAFECVLPALQSKAVSPQLEKVNLISD